MVTQEDGDDRRWSLTTAQTVIVSSTSCRHAQKVSIKVDAAQESAEHEQELQIIFWMFSRFQQVFSSIGTEREVVVLARTVYVGKWFFVQQTSKSMFFADGAHGFHNQLVVVAGNVCSGIFWSQLMLCRSSFVVFGLAGNAHFAQIFVQILHEFSNTNPDSSTVVVIQFLTFCRFCTEQSASADFQVKALVVQLVIYKEVFLFCTDHWNDLGNGLVAQSAQKTYTFLRNCLHGTKQRCFCIQCLSVVGAECSRDKQSSITDKCWGSWVPCGVSSCFKGSTQSTGWEGGGVCFTFD